MVSCGFLEAHGQAAEVLEAAVHALDEVAGAEGLFVVGVRMLAYRVRRDDGLCAVVFEPTARRAGILGAVREQTATWLRDVEDSPRAGQIMDVARCEHGSGRPVIARRSSTRWAPRHPLGKCGSLAIHSASLNQ